VGPVTTALFGAAAVRKAVRDFRSELVMPRSLMPALAVLAAGGRRLRPMIFDADGLEADERVDFRGLSRVGPVYRLLRMIERQAVRAAESVLVRTESAAEILSWRASVELNRFHVVTNGRDPAFFRTPTEHERQRARAQLRLDPNTPLLAYVGSIGPQYRLDLVADILAALQQRSAEARLLILTSEPSSAIDALERHRPGIGASTIAVHVESGRIPFLLGAADAGLAFRSEAFSTRAIAPIKLGEYLLCGLPVIGTPGVGNSRTAIEAGVFVADRAVPDAAADWLLNDVTPNRESFTRRAREVGLELFSLDRAERDYLKAIAAACASRKDSI
jgi:glycosyltransferase involved in cell wall biosynthesis